MCRTSIRPWWICLHSAPLRPTPGIILLRKGYGVTFTSQIVTSPETKAVLKG